MVSMKGKLRNKTHIGTVVVFSKCTGVQVFPCVQQSQSRGHIQVCLSKMEACKTELVLGPSCLNVDISQNYLL